MSSTPVHPLGRYGYGHGRSFPSKHSDFRIRGPGRSGDIRSHRSALLDTSSFWRDLDLSQVLGDDETYGHTGCVNALSWSHDGSQLLSGSDDARLCIWEPDENTTPTTETPHPFRLKESIQTAHRANIFSAKFLPLAGHPTIASVAGDSRVMVYDVERLGRSTHMLNELDGRSGPGVREIMCHTDRVKRISTEDNPHVFLTVSEDGTVRQHDLRTSHRCRTEDPGRGTSCPVPLLEAPGGIELYTLSVSKLNPYLFTVAGTSAYAYLQDRRMTRQITEEWSHRVDPGCQVQCVRRFGLPPRAGKGQGGPKASRWDSPRHITAVRMSPDVSEDLIVSFSGFGVALYSIHDTPGQRADGMKDSVSSSRTRSESRDRQEQQGTVNESAQIETTMETRPTTVTTVEMASSVGPFEGESLPSTSLDQVSRRRYTSTDFLLSQGDSDGGVLSLESPGPAMSSSLGADTPLESSESGSVDEWSVDDEDSEVQDMEIETEGMNGSGWGQVPVIYPRATYKGARNVETVKDVSFGGARSDKVCSGSDDGNWFMWDKSTGQLEGIWEGDGSVVNVVEQHPSLPILAVSGIDSTVKIFAPLHDHLGISKRRIHHTDEIIARNQLPEPSPVGYSMRQYRMLIESRLARQLNGDEGESDEDAPCQVQ